MIRRSLLILIILLIPSIVSAQNRLPKPSGPVNDFADVIPASQERQIDAVCRELNQKTGAAVVVATVGDLQGVPVETYANELFNQWEIGQKGKDNGVLILLAVSDRKIWIEVGYGLEPILPDGKVGGILDQYVVPALSQNDFGNGLAGGATAIALVIAEDAGVTLTGQAAPMNRRPAPNQRRTRGLGIITIIIFIILMIVTRGRILPWLLFFLMMGGGRGGGGSFGGGGFGGGFGGFGGGSSGGGGAGRSF